jgi:hypothetical protein
MISYFPVVTGSLTVEGSVNISGGITASGGISISGSIASASFATTASFVALAQSASNAVSAATASFANTLTVAGNLTAQTLVVQTITSSVDFVTGSTRFGSIAANTHVFTGSVNITGSSTTIGTASFQTSGNNGIINLGGNTYYGQVKVDSNLGGIQINSIWGGANSGIIQLTNGTAGNVRLHIADNGNVGIGTIIPLNVLDVRAANATMGNYQTIQAFSTDSAAINLGGGISLGGYYTSTTSIAQFASIVGRKENGTSGNYDGYLAFGTNAQATGVVERMRITSAGNVLINTVSSIAPGGITYKLEVNGPAHMTELSLGDSYSRAVTTDSSWSSFQTIIPTNTLEVFAVYLITASYAIGGGSPYNVVTSFTFVTPNCNGGGGDNEFLPICSTHQGGTGTMSFRAVAASSQQSGGLQVKFNGFSTMTGTLTVRATRLKRNIG